MQTSSEPAVQYSTVEYYKIHGHQIYRCAIECVLNCMRSVSHIIIITYHVTADIYIYAIQYSEWILIQTFSLCVYISLRSPDISISFIIFSNSTKYVVVHQKCACHRLLYVNFSSFSRSPKHTAIESIYFIISGYDQQQMEDKHSLIVFHLCSSMRIYHHHHQQQ